MSSYFDYARPGLYRSRDGILFGVCKGFADYFDLSSFWVRMVTLGAFILTGFFPTVVVYLLAALMMKKESLYYY